MIIITFKLDTLQPGVLSQSQLPGDSSKRLCYCTKD
jgi:hypothetical protein